MFHYIKICRTSDGMIFIMYRLGQVLFFNTFLSLEQRSVNIFDILTRFVVVVVVTDLQPTGPEVKQRLCG